MKSSIRILMGIGFALGTLGLAGTDANACGNGKVIFEDKFETLDPSWGNPGTGLKVENGALVVTPATGRSWEAVSESDYYGDAAICVDATVTSGDPANSYIAIIFWYQDDDNTYDFGWWPNGKIDVERASKGKWLYPVGTTDVPAMKTGLGQTNNFEVETKGNKVTVYVNGTKINELNGKPPEGGGKVGFVVVSPKTGDPTVTKFTNFVVAEPR
jgi:hypothetical protein